jgi:hypothetical protein
MNNPDGPGTIPAEDVPVCVNVFGNAPRIARALGLNIDLPDVDGSQRYWQAIWGRPGNWKAPLRGKVSDLDEENGDPEWAELINYGSFSVHFDVEEGIGLDDGLPPSRRWPPLSAFTPPAHPSMAATSSSGYRAGGMRRSACPSASPTPTSVHLP